MDRLTVCYTKFMALPFLHTPRDHIRRVARALVVCRDAGEHARQQ
ncbi:hypothetical protein QFZ97_006681 [Paraburkholderia youngii]